MTKNSWLMLEYPALIKE